MYFKFKNISKVLLYGNILRQEVENNPNPHNKYATGQSYLSIIL